MLKDESRVSRNETRSYELGRHVIVDDGGNYVTFHKLNVRPVKIKKLIMPHNDSLSHLCSSVIGSSKFVHF